MGGDHRERAVCRQGAAGAKRKRMKKAWSKTKTGQHALPGLYT